MSGSEPAASGLSALQRATLAQRRAADPAASVWVSASAGSGKTKVLTDRVLSLLLSGCAPARLLCLTFTKAAAAEMANRVASRLAAWAISGDGELASELEKLSGQTPEPAQLLRARQLFALVLDTPGGMKIQTIHAFCQSLLGRFPLEAGISPQFRVLEERQASEMLAEARLAVLAGQGADPDEDVAHCLARISQHAAESTFAELLDDLLRQRGRLTALVRLLGGEAGLFAALRDPLGVGPEETRESILAPACRSDAFDGTSLTRVAEAMLGGGKTDQKHGRAIADWLASPDQREAGFDDYLGAFFTEKGRGEAYKRLIHKDALAQAPDGAEVLAREAERLFELRQRLNAVTVAEATEAFLQVGLAVIQAYQGRKRAQSLLDYDDMILLTRDLLQRSGVAPWVLFKLDGGLDHVLIDEAQDTNPDQWQVVQALTDEFFAGEGAADRPRTIFVVGDAKQSIYSFQGADPAAFDRMRHYFAQRVQQAEMAWENVDLGVSFRSTIPVLQAVDGTFAAPDVAEGVVPDLQELQHFPVRDAQGGQVELWPMVAPPSREDTAPWSLPLERQNALSARTRLAQAMAQKIAHWVKGEVGAVGEEAWLASQHRRVRAGDILVLVRRRDALVEEIVRALKGLDVPVAGVDRMVLTDQLAVMDLIALGRFLLLPEDDLTLACVLKGPFFGLDEEQLFQIAHGRPGSLWQALRAVGNQPPYGTAAATLSGLLARVDFKRPYDLYGEILGPGRGRHKLLRRLGPEAADPIEEFLGLALTYERENVPSLEGFLHWLELGQTEIKRDMEHGHDVVRVMTVHGAKGLQAPIVFLPDTLQEPQERSGLLWLDGADGVPLWPLNRRFDGPAAAMARAKVRLARQQEYRRLLYVAMTRAEDRLYVTGWQGGRKAPPGAWYNLIREAFEGDAAPLAAAKEALDYKAGMAAHLTESGWEGDAWRIQVPQLAAKPEEEGPVLAAVPPGVSGLPDWARHAAPAEPIPPKPLQPSRPSAPEPAVQSPLGWTAAKADDGRRFQRGRLIHRLLQSLPDLAPAERRAAAARFLASFPAGLDEGDREALIDEVLAVIEHPDHRDLFGPGSRAEVPIVGYRQSETDPLVVSGQVDRLLVTPARIAVVDFKTNRPPPRSVSQVANVYRQQLAAYRDILFQIYPGREIECYLLWTDVPHLMQVPPAELK